MTSSVSSELAAFAAEIRLDDVPAPTQERAKELLLDTVGCAVAGHRGEETGQIESFVEQVMGSGDATVIGRREPADIVGATLLNAYLTTAVTICDVYVPAHCHVTPEVVPPALAIAEREGADGADLLLALVVGLEVTSRVARGLHYRAFRSRGWHAPGVIGPLGAGAAVARLLGADRRQMVNVLGLAGSQAAGTWAAWGTPTVKFHQARGAVSGLLAGLLGLQGFEASPEILTHHDGGILNTYSDGGDPEAIVAKLGEEWELERISLRLWPGGTPLQTVITAVAELLDGGATPAPEEIERVTVTVAPGVYDAHARFVEPTGTFEALLSIHFVVTVLLHERELWLDHIGPEHYGDPVLRTFMRQRVALQADDGLTPTMCRVEIRHGGTTTDHTVTAPKGHPDNPATRDELTHKFRRCTGDHLTAPEPLIEALLSLEQRGNAGGLLAATREVSP